MPPITETNLRFVLPDRLTGSGQSGLVIAPTGGFDRVAGDAAVRQAILLLLRTVPGERVMRADYGCNLHRLVFAPNDDTTAGLAIHYIRAAIDRWEPRIEIVRLDVGADESRPEVLAATLQYRVLATQRLDDLNFTVSLDGEAR